MELGRDIGEQISSCARRFAYVLYLLAPSRLHVCFLTSCGYQGSKPLYGEFCAARAFFLSRRHLHTHLSNGTKLERTTVLSPLARFKVRIDLTLGTLQR